MRNRRFRSLAFYLSMGYIAVYALCTVAIYFISSYAITKTARSFDRQDVAAESEELLELIEQNADGNLLAEQVTTGRYPPSTIFVVRVINHRGLVEYTITWPRKIELPHWHDHAPGSHTSPLPPDGLSEYHLKELNRHIQIQTTHLADGRVLQVGKGSFLEVDQKSMLSRLLLIFAGLSTIFSVISAIIMLLLTLRPINRMAVSMNEIIITGAFEKGAPPVKSMIAELDTLGRLFTVMTAKYADLISAMRQTMDNVAHDFRTPMTRIRGAAELALNDHLLPPDLANTLADIIEECDRTQMQLQNIMDVRAMESGFVKLKPEPFNLKQLLAELADLYSLIAEEKEITLALHCRGSEPLICGDRARLARVFANLIDNALKYTAPRGEVELTIETTAKQILVTVRDSGIGIPPNEIELIWQRLFRGKEALTTEKGLGLGLNIVQVIVTAHGGNLAVESTPGKGSTFSVHLPR